MKLPCAYCGKDDNCDRYCHCMNCGSRRKNRLKMITLYGRELTYCSETCLNGLLDTLRTSTIKDKKQTKLQ